MCVCVWVGVSVCDECVWVCVCVLLELELVKMWTKIWRSSTTQEQQFISSSALIPTTTRMLLVLLLLPVVRLQQFDCCCCYWFNKKKHWWNSRMAKKLATRNLNKKSRLTTILKKYTFLRFFCKQTHLIFLNQPQAQILL